MRHIATPDTGLRRQRQDHPLSVARLNQRNFSMESLQRKPRKSTLFGLPYPFVGLDKPPKMPEVLNSSSIYVENHVFEAQKAENVFIFPLLFTFSAEIFGQFFAECASGRENCPARAFLTSTGLLSRTSLSSVRPR